MSHPHLTGSSVLIVDDNPRLLEDYKKFFQENGIIVHTAIDGGEAVPAAIKHAPDLILLDLMLPVMDGIHVLKELKKQEATASIPVVVLTALVNNQEKDTSLANGADDYLSKVDTTPQELMSAMRKVLSSHRKEHA